MEVFMVHRTFPTLPAGRHMISEAMPAFQDIPSPETAQEAMNGLMDGKTSFVIAHRLSTIRNADMILVVKNGNVVEQGTHNELISKNGFYSELYYSQFDKVEE